MVDGQFWPIRGLSHEHVHVNVCVGGTPGQGVVEVADRRG